MIVSEHLCGVAIAYQEGSSSRTKKLTPGVGRYQGSLLSYQKRKIADACEWIRTHSVHKPRIFVCTTSPNWGPEIYQPKISQFCHTLRNGYGCENYIWVREFNTVGSPHYHFIADMDRISDPVGLSLYWSGLFGYHTRNSVRLGTKPDKTGRRTYILNSPQMAFYMAKYLGKELNRKIFKNSWHSATMPGRNFGISQQAAAQSAPIKFEANYFFQGDDRLIMNAHGKMVKAPSTCIGVSYENEIGERFNKYDYTWTKSKEHQVWFGKKKIQMPGEKNPKK